MTLDNVVGALGFGLSSALLLSYNFAKRQKCRSKVQSALDTWYAGGLLPCAQFLVLKEDEELFYGTSGHANEQKESIRRDTLFRIYSMTKPVCVVSALILVDRGQLSLDDPVSKWIPAFSNGQVYLSGDENNPQTEPVARAVTVRDLMMHTSGLSYGTFGSSTVDKILQNKVGKDWQNFYKNTSLEVVCNCAGETPLSFQPGTKWQYGLSIDVLGRVIEVVSGMTLDAFFSKEVFEPLQMHDTSFWVKEEDLHRLVDCYDYKATSGFALSTVPERDRSKKPVFLSGGGGLVSTITDYGRFVRSLFTNSKTSLLTPETVELMHTNLLPDGKTIQDVGVDGFSEISGPGVGFGLGVSVVTDPTVSPGSQLSNAGEFGWGGLASTWFFIDPVKNLSGIFFSQVIPSTKVNNRTQLRWLAHRLNDEQS